MRKADFGLRNLQKFSIRQCAKELNATFSPLSEHGSFLDRYKQECAEQGFGHRETSVVESVFGHIAVHLSDRHTVPLPRDLIRQLPIVFKVGWVQAAQCSREVASNRFYRPTLHVKRWL